MAAIGYVLPRARACEEIEIEMSALAGLGNEVRPIVAAEASREAPTARARIASAWQAMRGGRMLAAQRAARALCGAGAVAALWRASRIAVEARAAGVAHLHAPHTETTVPALLAARIAGLTVSFTAADTDTPTTDAALVHRLAAADLGVARDFRSLRRMRHLAPLAPTVLVRGGAVVADRRMLPDRLAQAPRLVAPCHLSEPGGIGDLLLGMLRVPTRLRPRIELLGEGPLAANVAEFIDATGLRPWVTMLGRRPSTWITRHALRYGGVVAAPHHGSGEAAQAASLGVKAAMAAGLPAIVSHAAGLDELVTPENGLMVSPRSPLALGEAIAALMRLPPAQRTAMGEAAREGAAERFCAVRQAAQLAGAIADLRVTEPVAA